MPAKSPKRSPGASLQAPLQARSRRNLTRLLDSAEELLRERPFEAITVGELVAHAGTSVGAFYARFRDKDALLPALYARYDSWVGTEVGPLTQAQPWIGRTLAEIAQWLAEELVQFFRSRRHFLRAMALHARTRPDKIDPETRAQRQREMAFLREALLSQRDSISCADPERAVELAVLFAASTIRDVVLFGDAPHAASAALDDTELMREVASMVLGYLSLPGPPADPSLE
jgi:AcrR family transcriptional regulator